MPINRAEKWPGPRCVTRLSPSPGREPGTEQGEGIAFGMSLQMNDVEKAGTRLPADASILWGKNGCLREPHPHSLYQGAYVLGRAGGMRLSPKEG